MKKTCNVCGGKIVRGKCKQCGYSESSQSDYNEIECDLGENLEEKLGDNLIKDFEDDNDRQGYGIKGSAGTEVESEMTKMYNKRRKEFERQSGVTSVKKRPNPIFMLIIIIMIAFPVYLVVAKGVMFGIDVISEPGDIKVVDLLDDEFAYKFTKEKMSETGSTYKKTLTSGDYKVGVHIPEGTYTVTTLNDGSIIKVLDRYNGINIMEYGSVLLDPDHKKIEYKNVYLFEGATLGVSGPSDVKVVAENGRTLKEVEPTTEKETIPVETGYVAGVDFPVGTYDVELKSGGEWGELQKDGPKTFDILNVNLEETKMFYNIEFPEGTVVTIEDATAVFTTSEINTLDVVFEKSE